MWDNRRYNQDWNAIKNSQSQLIRGNWFNKTHHQLGWPIHKWIQNLFPKVIKSKFEVRFEISLTDTSLGEALDAVLDRVCHNDILTEGWKYFIVTAGRDHQLMIARDWDSETAEGQNCLYRPLCLTVFYFAAQQCEVS